MRTCEVRRCERCGHQMRKVPNSERTTPKRVWFELRCSWCGHREMDWHERRNGKAM